MIRKQVTMRQLLRAFDLPGAGSHKNQIVIKSPFRQEETASLSINLELNIWNDMGGRPKLPDGRTVPGDTVGFVQAMRKCGLREALEWMVETFELGIDEKGLEVSVVRESVARLGDEPTKPGSFELPPNKPFGKEIKGLRRNIPYFEERGIREETAKYFGSGFYPRKGLMENRVIFPIHNIEGELMAYAGRSLSEENLPYPYKLPNGFHKSLELFNVHRLVHYERIKEVVKKHGIIVVEGFSDVLKLHQEGFPNVVATMGCNMSGVQATFLIDPAINPRAAIKLFYDNDKAEARQGQAEAAALLYEKCWVRGVDYTQSTEGKTEPEHFERPELEILLRQKAIDW